MNNLPSENYFEPRRGQPGQPQQTAPVTGAVHGRTIQTDDECNTILNSISPELRNAFILLSIKKLSTDSIYFDFFKIKSEEEVLSNQVTDELVQENRIEPSQLVEQPITDQNNQAVVGAFSDW